MKRLRRFNESVENTLDKGFFISFI